MVFQNYALYPHMSVYDNMAYGLKIRRLSKDEIRKRVEDAADILEIRHCWTASPTAFRWSTSARCHGPRHRARSAGLPCSMNHSQTSTPNCVFRCGWRSSHCSAVLA